MKLAVLLVLLALAPARAAAEPAPTIWDGVYSAEQAARGERIYGARCAACHGGGLEGADINPPLVGDRFIANWTGATAADLVERIRVTMPLDDPGALGSSSAADVTAFLLRMNRAAPGATPLPRETAALAQIRVTPRRAPAP